MAPFRYPEPDFGPEDSTSSQLVLAANEFSDRTAPPVCAAAALLFAMFTGTGSAMTTGGAVTLSRAAEPTSTTCQIECVVTANRKTDEEQLEVSQKLAYIQHHFSLNLTMLASTLRVSRPTLYSWLGEDSEPHPQKLLRIEQLYRLAVSWRRLCIAPLGRIGRRPLAAGRSILDLLQTEALEEASIRSALRLVAGMVERVQPPQTTRSLTVQLRQQYGMPEESAEQRRQRMLDNAGL